jgi:hypothetical protein
MQQGLRAKGGKEVQGDDEFTSSTAGNGEFVTTRLLYIRVEPEVGR